MRLFSLVVIWFLIGSNEHLNAQMLSDKQAFPFYEEAFEMKKLSNGKDSVALVSDTFGNPLFYMQDVVTEVCEDKVCNPVQLTLFWDCAGEFLAFQVLKEAPLTKAGHLLFDKSDYYQLFHLLNSPGSKLAHYKKTDLIKHNRKNTGAIDGISGATIRISKEPMVNGAAFTCFTLWDIVYRQNPVKQIHPDTLINKEVMESGLEAPEKLNAYKLAVLLHQADMENKLRKLTIQKQLTACLEQMTPLQCLLVSNYLGRQKYLYPEASKALKSCKKIEHSFTSMIP